MSYLSLGTVLASVDALLDLAQGDRSFRIQRVQQPGLGLQAPGGWDAREMGAGEGS